MTFTSTDKLKAWMKKKSKETGISTDSLYKTYMQERLLERIALSKYRDKLIIKGGFLIASMIGINMRSTMDMDATVKNLEMNRNNIRDIINEIISINIDDGITFEILSITDIHEESDYDDFRIIMKAWFRTMWFHIKVELTVGHAVIPHEIEYSYKLMFEERTISVMAYNLDTIFAEKIESILSKGVSNTRMRDYYDVYILVSLNKDSLMRSKILNAINVKAKERNSLKLVEGYDTNLVSIEKSPEIMKQWRAYQEEYHYAQDIEFANIIKAVRWLFVGDLTQ